MTISFYRPLIFAYQQPSTFTNQKTFVDQQHIIDFSQPLTVVDLQLLSIRNLSRPLTFYDHQLLPTINFYLPSTFVDHQLLVTVNFCPPTTFVIC